MDACTYESITGLKNYYGFKSILKNGLSTQRYSCDDDTIVFNRIVSTTANYTIASNQVGVILNYTSSYGSTAPGIFNQEVCLVLNVNGSAIAIIPNQLIFGQVFTGGVSVSTFFGVNAQLTFAIFDLY